MSDYLDHPKAEAEEAEVPREENAALKATIDRMRKSATQEDFEGAFA